MKLPTRVSGVLGVKVRQNGTVALTDAFRVVKEGAGQLLNLAPNIKPLHECIDRPMSGDWTTDIGMKFYRYIASPNFANFASYL